MNLGQNLQAIREKAGLSQSQLATKAGVSIKTLQNWEIGRNQPRLEALVKLAQALEVPLERIAVVDSGSAQTGGKKKGAPKRRKVPPRPPKRK